MTTNDQPIAELEDQATIDLSSSVHNVLRAAEEMIGQVRREVEPYSRAEQLVHLLFFRRFTELQYEYCRALRTLYEADCFQGTIPVLRNLVEVSVAQIKLHGDTDFSVLLELLKGERMRIAPALKEIGWPDSQDDVYGLLSRMTHPSRTSAFLGRTLDFESEPLKSLIDRQDIANVAAVILWQAAPESAEARQEKWLFVALTTFDLTISCLFTLYRAHAPECDWWRRANILLFEDLAERYPRMKQNLLWFRLAWPDSKLSHLERSIEEIFQRDWRSIIYRRAVLCTVAAMPLPR